MKQAAAVSLGAADPVRRVVADGEPDAEGAGLVLVKPGVRERKVPSRLIKAAATAYPTGGVRGLVVAVAMRSRVAGQGDGGRIQAPAVLDAESLPEGQRHRAASGGIARPMPPKSVCVIWVSPPAM